MTYIVTIGDQDFTVEVGPGVVSLDGASCSAELAEIEGTPVRQVTIDSVVHRVIVRRKHSRGRFTLWLDGFVFEAEALDERTKAIRDLTAEVAVQAGPAPIVAPMPGLIVRVSVKAGDVVRAGHGVVVMEAMKMENELRAPADGTVRAVLVQAGQAVEKGAVLVEFTTDESD